MLRGYEIISELKAELEKFMVDHKFTNLRDFIGTSLPYFTTHHDLVDRQKATRDAKVATSEYDDTWPQQDFSGVDTTAPVDEETDDKPQEVEVKGIEGTTSRYDVRATLEDRAAKVYVWNTRPKNLEYYTEKWNEFLAA